MTLTLVLSITLVRIRNEFFEKTICVTHHAPSRSGDPLRCFFSSTFAITRACNLSFYANYAFDSVCRASKKTTYPTRSAWRSLSSSPSHSKPPRPMMCPRSLSPSPPLHPRTRSRRCRTHQRLRLRWARPSPSSPVLRQWPRRPRRSRLRCQFRPDCRSHQEHHFRHQSWMMHLRRRRKRRMIGRTSRTWCCPRCSFPSRTYVGFHITSIPTLSPHFALILDQSTDSHGCRPTRSPFFWPNTFRLNSVHREMSLVTGSVRTYIPLWYVASWNFYIKD
jgi:hypothetical protein